MNPFSQKTLLALNTDGLLQTPPQGPSTLAYILAGVLAGLLIALIVWLLVSKHLTKWAGAALQRNKWLRKDHKLTTELKKLASALNVQHAELGKETWEARLTHPSYEPAYNKIVNVNQQKVGMEMHASSLGDELKKLEQDIETITRRYDQSLAEIESNRKITQTEVDALTQQHKTLDTAFTDLNLERARVQREIKETRTSIIDIENSDAPNKTALVFPLNSKLEQLSISLSDFSAKSPNLDEQLKQIEDALQPTNLKLEELAGELNRTQILKKQELMPLEEQLSKLKQSIKKKQEEIAQLDASMPAMLEELGAHVDHARPESLRLAPLYTNLDDIYERTRRATEDQHALRLDMDKGDKASARNFKLFLALVVLMIAAIVLILIFV